MKKLILGSLALLLFSVAAIVFQVSCTKTVLARDYKENDDNAILYIRQNPSEYAQLWAVNLDGTNDHLINLTLPSGWVIQPYSSARFSDKNNRIIFTAGGANADNANIMAFFSCKLDGTNVIKIKEPPVTDNIITIQDLY